MVLITGATSGIGEGTAYAFAKARAKVFFCGRRENLGKQVEARIKDFGGFATYMQADVRREEDVKAFVDACVKKSGRLDIAFNNAGIATPKNAPLAEQLSNDWLDVLNTVDTPMRRRAYEAQGYTGPQPAPMPNIPRRVNTVAEMADVVLFLASNAASSLMGTDLDVTGGNLTGAFFSRD